MIAGTLRKEQAATRTVPIFRSSESGPGTCIPDLAALCCRRCRGPVYADEFDIVYRYLPGTQPIEQPRRGRPPKHLDRQPEPRPA
jgi:hypothetical protein